MREQIIKLKNGRMIDLNFLSDINLHYSIKENKIYIYDLTLDTPHIFTGEIENED